MVHGVVSALNSKRIKITTVGAYAGKTTVVVVRKRWRRQRRAT